MSTRYRNARHAVVRQSVQRSAAGRLPQHGTAAGTTLRDEPQARGHQARENRFPSYKRSAMLSSFCREIAGVSGLKPDWGPCRFGRRLRSQTVGSHPRHTLPARGGRRCRCCCSSTRAQPAPANRQPADACVSSTASARGLPRVPQSRTALECASRSPAAPATGAICHVERRAALRRRARLPRFRDTAPCAWCPATGSRPPFAGAGRHGA